MTVSTMDVIMRRIKSANPESPLAIFPCKIKGKLDAIFANTIRGQIRVKKDRTLIGLFTNLMWRDEIYHALHNALRK